MLKRQGSSGNVIAAVASFFLPGLGQLTQGRIGSALFFFIATGILWFVSFGTLGWVGHIWSCYSAATWQS
jgi:TM2 domain-containing membrane protein YozV